MSQRADLVSRVSDALLLGANVAIHASPGAGKTWVADAVTADVRMRGLDVVRLDLSTLDNGAAVLTAAQAGLTKEKSAHDPMSLDLCSTHKAWRAFTGALTKQSTRTVLVLDQFDSVLDYPDALDFLKLLRELVHRPNVTNCNGLFASRRSLETIETKVRGISTLASVCFSEYLGAITDEDLTGLWPGAMGLDHDERKACLVWSGGHPALVQYWLIARPDVLAFDGADNQQIEVMQRLVGYLDGLGLLSATAQLVLGPVVDDWLRERKQLVALGVIGRGDDDHRMTLSQHDIFREALRRRTWDLNPWGVFGEAEVRTRGLVDNVLSSEFGPEWIEAARQGNRGVDAVHVEARKKQEQDARKFGRPGTWLAYTYPQDLWTIISTQWKLFSPIFTGGDKNYWRARFEGLAGYRTPMAHNRPESLTTHQRLQCRVYSEEILRRIDDHDGRRSHRAD